MDNEEIKELAVEIANHIHDNLYVDDEIYDLIFHKLHEKFNKEKYPGL